MRFRICLLITVVAGCAAAEEEGSSRGFTFSERFQGSANAVGIVTRLDSSAGYNFSRHFGADVGLPVYFIRPSDSLAASLGTARTGIGNLYADVRVQAQSPILNFASVLTGAAPTGDKARGFSTGRPTIDWSNYFDHGFGRLTPFGVAGVANTVSDTPFLIRPFTSLGTVGHFEGGLQYRLARAASVGASAYSIVPSGQQTIVSRVVGTRSAAPAGRGVGAGRNKNSFEVEAETVGTADLARDHGFSTWIALRPASYVDFEIGYSRSVPFDLNTFFFNAGFQWGSWLRTRR